MKKGNYWPLFFVLAVVAFVFLLDEVSLTGGTVQTISLMQKGQSLLFEVHTIAGLKDATVTFKETVKDGKIIFEQKEFLFKGKAFSKFSVSSPAAQSLGRMIFTLKINEVELRTKGMFVEKVKLYKDNLPLETVLTARKEGYVYYTVMAAGVGDYVIGTADASTSPEVKEASVEATKQEPAVVGKAVQTETTAPSWWNAVKEFFRNLFRS